LRFNPGLLWNFREAWETLLTRRQTVITDHIVLENERPKTSFFSGTKRTKNAPIKFNPVAGSLSSVSELLQSINQSINQDFSSG